MLITRCRTFQQHAACHIAEVLLHALVASTRMRYRSMHSILPRTTSLEILYHSLALPFLQSSAFQPRIFGSSMSKAKSMALPLSATTSLTLVTPRAALKRATCTFIPLQSQLICSASVAVLQATLMKPRLGS